MGGRYSICCDNYYFLLNYKLCGSPVNGSRKGFQCGFWVVLPFQCFGCLICSDFLYIAWGFSGGFLDRFGARVVNGFFSDIDSSCCPISIFKKWLWLV